MEKIFDVTSERVHEFVKEVALLVGSSELEDKYNLMVAIIGCAALSEVIAANCGIDHKAWKAIIAKSKEIREQIVSMVDADVIAHVEELTDEEYDEFEEDDEYEDSENDDAGTDKPKTKDRVIVGAPILGRF